MGEFEFEMVHHLSWKFPIIPSGFSIFCFPSPQGRTPPKKSKNVLRSPEFAFRVDKAGEEQKSEKSKVRKKLTFDFHFSPSTRDDLKNGL